MRTSIFRLAPSLALCLGFVTACGGDDGGGMTGDPDASMGVDGNGGQDGSTACSRAPGADDRTRFVVVAHPYTGGGSPSSAYEVLELTANGKLTRFAPPRTFELGARTPFGTIAFTPNGVGVVAMDNGNLGIFRLDDEGMPTVVAPNFDGAFYAERVVMDPSGERVWVIDRNTRDNDGGIYRVDLACDGTPTDGGLVVAGGSIGGLGFVGDNAVVSGREVLDSTTTPDDVHLLSWGTTPARIGGTDAFGDDNQVLSGFTLNHDGTKAIVGDSNVAGTNRVAIVGVSATALTPIAVLNDITDPSSMAASPYGDVVVVSASQPGGMYDEGIWVLDTGGAAGAWQVRGELTYANGRAVLPGDMVTIDRGQLAGSVIVSELSNVRRLMFRATGEVDDVDSVTTDETGDGDDLSAINGAIGVTR